MCWPRRIVPLANWRSKVSKTYYKFWFDGREMWFTVISKKTGGRVRSARAW
jgi:hypothetical protein